MDIAHVHRLKEEQQKGLHLCEEKISQWEKFKTDYEVLKQRLETFPDALSYDITVPFGSQAFTKGKVVHTNEVMVLLGDNWFAEVSAKQASSIAERRVKQCVEMLDGLNKEKEKLNDWVKYIEEVSPAANEDLVEIIEKYDEEQERQWREQHAERVRSHRQQLARERQNSGGSVSEEDQVLLRLDSLEESESQGKSSEEGSSFFEEGSDSEATDALQRLKLDCDKAKSFGSRERVRTVTESSESTECSSSLENGKHVRWQDLSRQNIKRITFKHTKNQVKNRHQSSNFVPAEGVDRLQSPSDIYRQFGAFFQSSPPKSILKVKHSPSSESEEPFFPPKDPTQDCSPKQEEVIGEVRENSSPIHITSQKKSRPVSHFKNSRKNRKKC